jgi:hypothetical protein
MCFKLLFDRTEVKTMYTAINGIYENGQVILQEAPPTLQKSKVVVMFITEEDKATPLTSKGVKLGSLTGKGYSIPNDFNLPLEDLKDYM